MQSKAWERRRGMEPEPEEKASDCGADLTPGGGKEGRKTARDSKHKAGETARSALEPRCLSEDTCFRWSWPDPAPPAMLSTGLGAAQRGVASATTLLWVPRLLQLEAFSQRHP